MKSLKGYRKDLSYFLFYAVYLAFIFVAIERIKSLTGSSLVADEGVFLSYVHQLSGKPLSTIEMQHINGYGPIYWVQCLLLVFPAAILNKVGIEGVTSLRIVVWIMGALCFYLLSRIARVKQCKESLVLLIGFALFPVGNMIRFFGLKDMVTGTLLLLVVFLISNEILRNKHMSQPVKTCVRLNLICTTFFFIQNNFILIFILTFLILFLLKRGRIWLFSGLILSFNFLVLNLIFRNIQSSANESLAKQISGITSTSTLELLPIQKITTLKGNAGGTFIPESLIKFPDFLIHNPPTQSNKLFHLIYVNLSNPLSILVSLESIFWLISLFTIFTYIKLKRNLSTNQVFMVSVCLISFFSILLYDENFGTYLRHRSALVPTFIFTFILLKESGIKYGMFSLLPRDRKVCQ